MVICLPKDVGVSHEKRLKANRSESHRSVFTRYKEGSVMGHALYS